MKQWDKRVRDIAGFRRNEKRNRGTERTGTVVVVGMTTCIVGEIGLDVPYMMHQLFL